MYSHPMMESDKWFAKEANKSRKYWESMRSNMNLLDKSEKYDEVTLEHLRSELEDILDSGILSYPHTLTQIGVDKEMSYKERRHAFDLKPFQGQHTEEQQKLLKSLEYKAMQVRKSNWSWRIGQEAEELQAKGWYPFFVTLTVDPKKIDPKKLWTETREFRKYIRKLANIVCKELGVHPCHKPPYRSESEYVRYAGVIEHGKTREHHHGHFVIWLRSCPSSWRICPNTGINDKYKRTRNECLPMSTVWKWASYDPATGRYLSPALYFRSIGDVWEKKCNFVLPIDTKTGQPLKISIPRIAGVYITKYLSKEHKEWHHRMKATRNLGMNRLKEVIRNLDPKVVEALSWRADNSITNHSLMLIHSVPIGLVRSEAQTQHYCNQFRQNQLDLRTLLRSNIGVFTRMLKSVLAGARPDRMHSSEFFDWVGKLLPVEKGYSNLKHQAAHCEIAKVFPPIRKQPKHTKMGGNRVEAR